jgi:hypothetical protein
VPFSIPSFESYNLILPSTSPTASKVLESSSTRDDTALGKTNSKSHDRCPKPLGANELNTSSADPISVSSPGPMCIFWWEKCAEELCDEEEFDVNVSNDIKGNRFTL